MEERSHGLIWRTAPKVTSRGWGHPRISHVRMPGVWAETREWIFPGRSQTR